MPEIELSRQLEAPLALLKQVTEHSFRSGTVPSRQQLDGQLSHLRSAISDVVELVNQAVATAIRQTGEEIEPSEAGLNTLKEELQAVQVELEEQFLTVSESLFAARGFEELATAQEAIDGAALGMEGSLARLEGFLERLDFEPADSISERAKVEEAGEILELLASAIESVERHLEQGDGKPLEQALFLVERAAEVLRAIQSFSDSEATSERDRDF